MTDLFGWFPDLFAWVPALFEWFSADGFRLANGVLSLVVLFFWTVSGLVRAATSEPFENFVTLFVGFVFFLLAYGSWEAVYGSATPYRVFAFTAVLSVLGGGMAWRVLLYDRHTTT